MIKTAERNKIQLFLDSKAKHKMHAQGAGAPQVS